MVCEEKDENNDKKKQSKKSRIKDARDPSEMIKDLVNDNNLQNKLRNTILSDGKAAARKLASSIKNSKPISYAQQIWNDSQKNDKRLASKIKGNNKNNAAIKINPARINRFIRKPIKPAPPRRIDNDSDMASVSSSKSSTKPRLFIL